VEVVIHFGADPRPDAPFESLLTNNYAATYTVFEAAREAGCRRVIFASSTRTSGAFPNDRRNIGEHEHRPGNLYAVSKLYGESLANYYAHVCGLSVICLRLGWVAPPLEELRSATNWFPSAFLSARDLCHLLDLASTTSLHFAVLNASSDNRSNRLDLSRTRSLLGYRPQDCVEDLG